jgi:3-isopropylmalate/(R)-2-methylmalate dehydratase small subunit
LPAEYLKRVTKTGFEDALFAGWRQDPDFVLNQPEYADPRVLVVGPDFGTGSSREHAVWALRDFGFRAVIGPRFGDIFRGNAGKQGLLVGVVSDDEVEQLWDALEAEPGRDATVDLESQKVRVGELEFDFEIDPYIRWRLLEGLDDIDLTLRDEAAIDEYEKTRPSWMPRTLPALGETEPGNPAITFIEIGRKRA